jgi:hypothetical protein
MRGGSYRRGPRLAQPRKDALGRGKQPRLSEASQRPTVASLESFPWKPGERVDGPPRIKTDPFVNLPPDGCGS